VKKGLEIIKGLRGFTSGYAIPTFVVDAPVAEEKSLCFRIMLLNITTKK